MNKLWKILRNTLLKRISADYAGSVFGSAVRCLIFVKHACGNAFHSTMLKSGFLWG